MSVGDFQIKVSGDFSDFIGRLGQLPQEASKAGQGIGKGLDDGIKQYSEKSLAALNAELNRLQQRQIKVAVDSTAFQKAGVDISKVQALITAVEKQRLLIGVDDRSITALQVKLADLQNKQTKVSVDSQEFVDLQRQINATEKELNEISQRKVLISVDDRSVTALQVKLQDLQTRQTKVSVDSTEFIDLQRQINRVEQELEGISRRKVLIDADANSFLSITAKLQGELDKLQQRQVRVDVDSQEFIALGREIDRIEIELSNLERKRTQVNIDDSSLVSLQQRLQALQTQQTKVSVDSTEFIDLQRQIDAVENDLADVNRRKVLISADPSSIIALRSRLSELQAQLERTQIGSQRFKELQSAVKNTEREIASASQSTRKLSDILSTNISGGIFGQLAGFASAGAIVGFLKSSVDAAVQLETITRKLSNTLGAQGAAGALAFTRQLSDELGLSFNTLSNTFGGFTAAATAAGVPMQQQKDLFAAVSKSAQQLGLSNDELSGSLLALQQVASKGTVQMEELRGQLGERLPVAFGATAKGLGITQQELGKLVESGGLSAERFFEGLTKGLNELNSDGGGLPTAAQNFQKLQNAWTDLQANFGTSLLPSITQATRDLAGALEGLRIDVAARDLRQSFGVTAQEAVGLVGVMEMVQKQFGLTSQQAKNLLSDAIANTDASRDWFGELNLGGKRFEQVQLSLIDLAKQYRNANPDAAARIREEAIEAQKVEQQRRLTLALEEQRVASARDLAKAMQEGEISQLQNSITLGNALLSLAQSQAAQEQSKFAVVKAGLEFELKSAQERGASEAEIGAIKKQIQEVDRQAAEARYQALQQEQALQVKMLELSQEKARTEANLEVLDARNQRLELEKELKKATTEAEKESLNKQIELQDQIIGRVQGKYDLLAQIQPLEQKSLKAQQETAVNTEKAKLEQQGFKLAADGSLVAVAGLAGESKKAKEQAEALRGVQQQISEIITQATVQQATQQVAVAEKLLGLARALGAEEQSRFNLVRSNLEYELKKAEERGASESEIARIKQKIQKNDQAAAVARFNALLQQQQLEAKMLEIAQQKQRLEANVEFRKQQVALLESEFKLREALLSGDERAILIANENVNIQRMRVNLAGQQLISLNETQSLERRILASQQQSAINAERASAAQLGIKLAAAGSAVNMKQLASSASIFNQLAAVGAASQQRVQGFIEGTANSANKLNDSLEDSKSPSEDIATAFTSTSNKAPAIEQGARNFAGWLSGAKTFAKELAAVPLEKQMATVANETARAAGAARVFYEWLERASRLPGSRWSGGPVEAGEQYRVNELGQEALLSGGRLSLINAPANSLWRAPTNGTVIPAGITSRLQEQGALSGRGGGAVPMGGGGTNAQLAVEVGKLRQEVGELARKQWNVNITTKTGPTGSQVLKQMLR